MKKNSFSVVLLLMLATIFYSCHKKEEVVLAKSSYSVQLIPEVLARQIAKNISIEFLQGKDSKSGNSANREVITIPNREVSDVIIAPDANNNPALYIYNYANREGFVVISADLRHEPICAFIPKGNFEAGEVPSMLIEWFNKTIENIELVRNEKYDNTKRANYFWNDLIKNTNLTALNQALKLPVPRPIEVDDEGNPTYPGGPPPANPCNSGNYSITRGPLMTTTWGQGCTYNEQCEPRACTNICGSNNNAWTGCVATAMSQILKYWSHPNSYNYNYTSMPNNSGNSEVQRMMYNTGKNVKMDYGCSASGAYDYEIDDAFLNNFNFSSANGTTFINQHNYNSGSYSVVESNINAGWPVILGGYRTQSGGFLGMWYSYSNGHSWVCDGTWNYGNNCYGALQFHMNWGWGTANGVPPYNGWYGFNNWNASTTYNYQYARSFTYNIHP